MSYQADRWRRMQRGMPDKLRMTLNELAASHTQEHGCFPTQENMAIWCECSLASLKRHLNDLCFLGLISKVTRFREDKRRTAYVLHFNVVVRNIPTERRAFRKHLDALKATQAAIPRDETKLQKAKRILAASGRKDVADGL
jgi:hypothetical protein